MIFIILFFCFIPVIIILLFNVIFKKPKKSKSRKVELIDNQIGLYYEIKKNPKSSRYQVAIGFNLEGKLDIIRFGRVLKLVREHMQIICCVVNESGTLKYKNFFN